MEVGFTVDVAFWADDPEIVTEGVTAQVAGLAAPAGFVVKAQPRATAPVRPPDGVTVLVDVLPVVAPAATVMVPL